VKRSPYLVAALLLKVLLK